MQQIAPLGKVYQAGTLSGNPIAMAAGYALLSYLNTNPNVYTELEDKGNMLEEGIARVMREKGMPFVINHLGSMISLHFSEKPVTDFASAASAHNDVFNRLFHHMLANGVYLPPSAYETWFISHAINSDDIEHTLEALRSF
jgi:glutamate-1-semialdehyde 2,1-aminomutase